MIKYSILSTCLLLLMLMACHRSDDKRASLSFLYKNGKKIELVDSLTVYNPEDGSYSTLKDHLRPDTKKIVVYINGTCFTCAEDFILWKDIMKLAEGKTNLDFLFYLHLYDFETMRPYFRKWRFSHPVIVDKGNRFFMTNQLVDTKESMILDENNKMIFEGNPLYFKDYKENYTTFISSL